MEVHDYGITELTVTVEPGDKLTAVPQTHRHLITDEIRSVFRDAPRYFTRLAQKTPFARMADWLNVCLRENRWRLVLSMSELGSERAGFEWVPDVARGAEIGLPQQIDTYKFPKPLAALFKLVGYVDWGGFRRDGLLYPPVEIMSLGRADPDRHENAGVDWEKTLVWGGFNGDLMFVAPDDRCGWTSVQGQLVLGGSVAEAVDWWFAELLTKQIPDFYAFQKAFGRN